MGAKQFIVRVIQLAAQGVIILSLSLVLMLGVLELWARLQPRRYFVEFDAELGFRKEPGADGIDRGRWFLAANPHINAPIRINQLGLRGPDREASKTPGTRRLLALGDSFVQAFEVPWEESFYARLEGRAQQARAGTLETFPMGVNGYGQGQQLLWLRRDGVHWNPDFVLLVVFLGNDITDNSKAIGAGASRPYFDLVDGELIQVAAPSDSARFKYWVADHFRSYLIYRELAVRFPGFNALARNLGWVNTPSRHRERGPNSESTRRLTEAWDLSFALISEIAAESRSTDAHFAIAYHGDFRTGTDETGRERIRRFCSAKSLDCLDLSKELLGDETNFIPDDDHWTAHGHARVSELIWQRWSNELMGSDGFEEPRNEGETDE